MVTPLAPPPWDARAACKGLSSDLFFPQDEQAETEAKAICRSCPVEEACLEHALAVREKEGIWGGATERERRSIIRRRRRAAAKERALQAEQAAPVESAMGMHSGGVAG